MGWTHTTGRSGGKRLAPAIDSLEPRRLLSTVDASTTVPAALSEPVPVGGGGGSTTGTDYQTITGASAVRSAYGVDGTGYAVAVIDTGVNYNHEALGGGFGPGHKVVAGYDFAQNDGDPAATWQHGTAVAGLIASSDPAHLGIAPGADIVALRVFGNDNKGDFNRVANALQWVIDNHDKYNITVVNISLSDGNNYTLNWFANDGGVGARITSLIRQLDTLNIPVVTATGNSFSGQQGQGFTSIVGDSISVTSTDAGDKFVGNAQRLGKSLGGANATDVAAPGAGMVAPVDGNNFSSGDGTSFSAPIVSGGIVLLQQLYKSRFGSLPTVDQIEGWLTSGGSSILDGVTGISIPRVDINRSAGLVPLAPAPVAQPTTPVAPVVAAPEPVVVPATPAPAPTPPPVSTVDVVTNADTTPTTAAKPKVDKVSQQFATLLQSMLNGQLKTVRVWGVKAAPTAAQTNSFTKVGLTNLSSLKSWNAVNGQQAVPTGKLALKHSALGRKARAR